MGALLFVTTLRADASLICIVALACESRMLRECTVRTVKIAAYIFPAPLRFISRSTVTNDRNESKPRISLSTGSR